MLRTINYFTTTIDVCVCAGVCVCVCVYVCEHILIVYIENPRSGYNIWAIHQLSFINSNNISEVLHVMRHYITHTNIHTHIHTHTQTYTHTHTHREREREREREKENHSIIPL